MQKITKHIILCICLSLIFISTSTGEDFWSTQSQTDTVETETAEAANIIIQTKPDDNWLTQAQMDITAPGIVETILIPELHWAAKSTTGIINNQMDVCLYGPDEKPRAFELFWREKGKANSVFLEKTNVKLQDDKKLMWEGTVPEKINVNRIVIDISENNYVGKVDIEGLNDSGWVWLKKDAALYKNNKLRQAEITINEGIYKKFRLYFSGYDNQYRETLLFVNTVKAIGDPSGQDYTDIVFKPEFKEKPNNQKTEIRIILPGLGIRINKIDITTSALFQGSWSIGREAVVLGKREIKEIKNGTAAQINNNGQTFSINIERQWKSRVLVIRMDSKDYFGNIQDINIHARVPRMVFFADQAGRYTAQTDCGKKINIISIASDSERAVEHEATFVDIERNHHWRPENLIEKYNIKGGPFNKAGYTWGAEVQIPEPGFYQLILNEQACLEKNISGLRLIKNHHQIPYFIGPQEKREIPLETAVIYEAENNRTVWTITLPFASAQWTEIQLRANGIFDRTLEFKKHKSGMVSWQPWKTRQWKSADNQASVFKLGLKEFPADQDEIQLIINHEDNQPLEINNISVLYNARDIFFLTDKSGNYELVGGNPHASSASYKDLEMIMDHLLDAMPKQVQMGPIEKMALSDEQTPAGGDIGGPFDGKGYTWTSKLNGVTKPGFYQLSLNQKASLEKNRHGLRLVKNNIQIPYFMGKPQKRKIEITAEGEYDRKKNKTFWEINLPQPSVHWDTIQLHADGVFDRMLIFEIRKPGQTGWQQWHRQRWTNRGKDKALCEVHLRRFPKDQTEMRLVIDHGDNQPLEINKIHAVYTTQNLFFVAREAGGFQLAGGNPNATAPSYDLALIKNHLLKSEPIKIVMDEVEELKPAEWETKLSHVFSEQGWGLYVVLGIVTLVLLVVIVRLFPKEENNESV